MLTQILTDVSNHLNKQGIDPSIQITMNPSNNNRRALESKP
nr:MAG TPA: hypothetical protein [Caudoviricetes sp.]